MSRPFYVSRFRMHEGGGTVDLERLGVYEVDAWGLQAAIDRLKKARPDLLIGTTEFLCAAPVPPDGWLEKVERVEVAP